MTIGTGTFLPWGRFSIPRSYVAGVVNYDAGFTLTQDVNKFALDFHPTYTSVYHWTFSLKFWLWSSNVWTLDHIITESYYVNLPDPTQIPLNFGLYWQRSGSDNRPRLHFLPNLSAVSPRTVLLPTYPPGYWARPT
ncbi:MAG TPA: hypothetical protein VLK33_23090 [Terriglobales bacterium]|nr:hypothetical protein [Terriglobales bacterium]